MSDLQQKDEVATRWGYSEGFQALVYRVQDTGCPVCGKMCLVVDVSMALIQCDSCGIAFEYRYNQGVIPFHTIIESGT